MTKTTAEPQQLLARLERKFVRKVQAEQSRRRTRGLRHSLSQMDGVSIGALGDDVIDTMHHYQEI